MSALNIPKIKVRLLRWAKSMRLKRPYEVQIGHLYNSDGDAYASVAIRRFTNVNDAAQFAGTLVNVLDCELIVSKPVQVELDAKFKVTP